MDSNYEPTDVPAYVALLRERAKQAYSEWWIEEYKKRDEKIAEERKRFERMNENA